MYERKAVSSNDMHAELARLRAENEALRAKATSKLRVARSEKGAVSVYGLRRFPVTFYAAEWERIFGLREQIEEFIRLAGDQLSRKPE